MQNELTNPGILLDAQGRLSQTGWARWPLLDCNLENARFYPLHFLQRFRLKRWDYYAVFTPQRFFSATVADLGYAGNIFVYTLDFTTGELHEEGLVIPLSRGITLARNPTEGDVCFEDRRARLSFRHFGDRRLVSVSWPGFHQGRGIRTEIGLSCAARHQSMTIVIPIGKRRFYYNHKVNCLPVDGYLEYGAHREELSPQTCLGSLDWGRGAWEYKSFWNWASASGFLPDGRTIGLNLGCGFGDTSAATEDCLVLDGCVHKLGAVKFTYNSGNYLHPWKFRDDQGRLELEFHPFRERVACTNLGVIFSEVHQVFGRYRGWGISDGGERIAIDGLVGFAEEHRARW
jgi:hypothetical protein